MLNMRFLTLLFGLIACQSLSWALAQETDDFIPMEVESPRTYKSFSQLFDHYLSALRHGQEQQASEIISELYAHFPMRMEAEQDCLLALEESHESFCQRITANSAEKAKSPSLFLSACQKSYSADIRKSVARHLELLRIIR